MKGLQVLITTHNEARNLPDCLDSVTGWASRILIVDSFSTDETPTIAAGYDASFQRRAYRSPADQKNWGLDQMEEGWVLILDADERVTPALKQEIEGVLDAPEHDAYWIPRRSRFLGKTITRAGWNRDGVIRLLKRDAGRYRDALVHEEMICSGSVGRLIMHLEHYSYHDVEDYLERMLRYSMSGAKQMQREGRAANPGKIMLRPPLRFMRMYLWQQGWRDGAHGFLLCVLSALQVALKHTLHWALARKLIRDEREHSPKE